MSKIFGQGTLLQRETSSGSGVYATVAQIQTFDESGSAIDELEVTDHDSPDGAKEFIPGLKDRGEISGTLYFDPNDATHDTVTGIEADKENRTIRSWQIVTQPGLAGENKRRVNGFVKEFNPSYPSDGPITATFTIRRTGALTVV